ncbi:hypothetical protein J1614_008178 [Plenodomus biglobosus]|nr:hypothetical protein J1614_008178 [Plenodomus biglobosus]
MWRDTSNQDRIDSFGIPSELINFLYARDAQGQWKRNVPKIRCVLGPYNDSWFAEDGNAYSWMNLPSQLLKVLQTKIQDGNWIDRPRTIALGAGNGFVLFTERHDAFWELNQYRTVSKMLGRIKSQRDGISSIHHLILHPYRYDSFITQTQSGVLTYGNLPPPSLASIEAMVKPITNDTNDAKWKPIAEISSASQTKASHRPTVLQQRASIKREWSQHNQEFSAQAKGMKVSLSLSVSIGGISRLLGQRS